MIDLYFWPTGNGKKVSIMLEEIGLPYRIIPVNINKGDQSTPSTMRSTPITRCLRSSTRTRRAVRS